jgi:hypothetical protein
MLLINGSVGLTGEVYYSDFGSEFRARSAGLAFGISAFLR